MLSNMLEKLQFKIYWYLTYLRDKDCMSLFRPMLDWLRYYVVYPFK
jgi:hypothetical protein